MKNVSANKNSSGRGAAPNMTKGGSVTGSNSPNMPRVGGHTTNNGNGKQGVKTPC